MVTDFMISFEYVVKKSHQDLSLEKDEDGAYKSKKTRLAFNFFCKGYSCGERG